MEGRFVTLFRPYSLIFEAVLEIVINKDVCSFEGRRAQLSSDTDAKQKSTPHKLFKGRNLLLKLGVGNPFNSCFVLELVFTVAAVREDSPVMIPERPHPPLSMLC
jgi:hypothetical protein